MNSYFIMSSERSGSNLLRKMLAMHPDIAAPPPPHLWRHLSTAIPYYGPIDNPEIFEQLVHDAVRLTQVEGSHLQWKYTLTVEAIMPYASEQNLAGIICALYNWYADQENKNSWVCKENNLFDFAFQIREQLPQAKFIYLCRDGRDYACSIKRVPSHDQHTYAIAQEWLEEQEKCLRVFQELKTRGAAYLLRYEALIEQPEQEMKQLCRFLGITFQPEMLSFYVEDESKSDAQKSTYLKNLDKPIMSQNKGKFLDLLPAKDIVLFERTAGKMLTLLGYPLVTESAHKPINRLSHFWYLFQNKVQVRSQRKNMLANAGQRERHAILNQIHARKYSQLDFTNYCSPTIEYNHSPYSN